MIDENKATGEAKKWLGVGVALVALGKTFTTITRNAETGAIDRLEFIGIPFFDRARRERRLARRRERNMPRRED